MSGVSFQRLPRCCTSLSTRAGSRRASLPSDSTRRVGSQLVGQGAEHAHERLVDHHLAQQARLVGQRPVAIGQLASVARTSSSSRACAKRR